MSTGRTDSRLLRRTVGRSLLLALWSLLLAGCLAPVARHTRLRRGLDFELGVGPSVFRGGSIVHDTSAWWGGRAVLADVNAGLYGSCRASYGFQDRYAADLSFALGYGPPVRPGGRWGGWLQFALAGRYRPWRSNNLFFAELGYPAIGIGWVAGLPQSGNERWSVMLEVGSALPDTLTLGITPELLEGLFPPNLIQCNIARNIYSRRNRISPNLGVGIGLKWSPFRPRVSSILAGVTWSPL